MLKEFVWDYDFTYVEYEYMRMDALVSEIFTFSDRIMDIYGFCGTGLLNEAAVHGDIERIAVPNDGRPKDENGIDVRNSILPSKKLEFALDMVEAVALLHSNPNGVIVHDDIQLPQFLLTDTGSLKLNDFNRAEIMLWNEEDQAYCRYRNGKGYGDVGTKSDLMMD